MSTCDQNNWVIRCSVVHSQSGQMFTSDMSRAQAWYGRLSKVISGSGWNRSAFTFHVMSWTPQGHCDWHHLLNTLLWGLLSSWVMEREVVVRTKLRRTKRSATQVFHRSIGNFVSEDRSAAGSSISILIAEPFRTRRGLGGWDVESKQAVVFKDLLWSNIRTKIATVWIQDSWYVNTPWNETCFSTKKYKYAVSRYIFIVDFTIYLGGLPSPPLPPSSASKGCRWWNSVSSPIINSWIAFVFVITLDCRSSWTSLDCRSYLYDSYVDCIGAVRVPWHLHSQGHILIMLNSNRRYTEVLGLLQRFSHTSI